MPKTVYGFHGVTDYRFILSPNKKPSLCKALHKDDKDRGSTLLRGNIRLDYPLSKRALRKGGFVFGRDACAHSHDARLSLSRYPRLLVLLTRRFGCIINYIP